MHSIKAYRFNQYFHVKTGQFVRRPEFKCSNDILSTNNKNIIYIGLPIENNFKHHHDDDIKNELEIVEYGKWKKNFKVFQNGTYTYLYKNNLVLRPRRKYDNFVELFYCEDMNKLKPIKYIHQNREIMFNDELGSDQHFHFIMSPTYYQDKWITNIGVYEDLTDTIFVYDKDVLTLRPRLRYRNIIILSHIILFFILLYMIFSL